MYILYIGMLYAKKLDPKKVLHMSKKNGHPSCFRYCALSAGIYYEIKLTAAPVLLDVGAFIIPSETCI